MMEESKNNILEEIIQNPVDVEAVLIAINDKLKIPYPHNKYSYFLTGHCNIYSLILLGIFKNYAIPYDNDEHIVTKIGDNYYDVEGLANWKVEDSNYRESSEVYLLEPIFTGLGEYKEGIDDKVVEEGVRIGREYIEELAKNNPEKKEGLSI